MMKKLQTMLRAIDVGGGFKDEPNAGSVASAGSTGEIGTQQRHAANPRPARLRGPWRPERSRRRRLGQATTRAATVFR
ncbi:hypothetical protein C0Z16_29950 [Paraburkholderia rhynchosiae]|uniref:Uncharacterized protein n=1 Tax=Paraburkholderia rhynchosiae TaxID=487049 RepID=A0ABX4UXP8_9BURK|nr:hypothetical protein C0Z16_29950 [Paraburkholderia rhynchosiae]